MQCAGFFPQYPSEASARLAADVILRSKSARFRVEAFLAKLMRDSNDPVSSLPPDGSRHGAALAAAALARARAGRWSL